MVGQRVGDLPGRVGRGFHVQSPPAVPRARVKKRLTRAGRAGSAASLHSRGTPGKRGEGFERADSWVIAHDWVKNARPSFRSQNEGKLHPGDHRCTLGREGTTVLHEGRRSRRLRPLTYAAGMFTAEQHCRRDGRPFLNTARSKVHLIQKMCPVNSARTSRMSGGMSSCCAEASQIGSWFCIVSRNDHMLCLREY